ncbi:MAG: hypothetical protein AB1942_23485 [Pseudomonadota bacterium]
MSTIRPYMTPSTTLPGGERQDAGKAAAQRAFFEALGKAQGTTATAAPAAPAQSAQTAQVSRVASAGAPSDQPQKILRPGSLLDIRV